MMNPEVFDGEYAAIDPAHKLVRIVLNIHWELQEGMKLSVKKALESILPEWLASWHDNGLDLWSIHFGHSQSLQALFLVFVC
jgi:hypothetical protein